MSKLFFSFEEEQNTTTKKPETELVVYARIGNLEGLKSALRKEHHEQVDSKFVTGERVRMRKTIDDKGTRYELTMKKALDESNGVVLRHDEYTQEVDSGFYEAFKNIAGTSISYKDRYVFTPKQTTIVGGGLDDVSNKDGIVIDVPLIQYEVDVFTDAEGQIKGWCKVDVELDGINSYLEQHYPDIKDTRFTVKISSLPFEPLNILTGTDEEKQQTIQKLWTEVFTTQLK